MARKIPIEVTAHIDREGKITPQAITWDDGRVFNIDRILDVCKAASLKVGGVGTRYTCRIRGKELHLYFDEIENIWFAEGK